MGDIFKVGFRDNYETEEGYKIEIETVLFADDIYKKETTATVSRNKRLLAVYLVKDKPFRIEKFIVDPLIEKPVLLELTLVVQENLENYITNLKQKPKANCK